MLIQYDPDDNRVLCPVCGRPMYAQVEACWTEPAHLEQDCEESGIIEISGDVESMEVIGLECHYCRNVIDLREELDIAYVPAEKKAKNAPKAKRAC